MTRLAVLVCLAAMLALTPAVAFASNVYYFIVYPAATNGWAPVRFDFLDLAQCASARTAAITRYTAAAVWSNGLGSCVTEVQP